MKSRFSIIGRGSLALAIPALAALAGMNVGCAERQLMASGPGVPASQGSVDATEGDNGNTNVNVRVQHLALPWNVASDATVYVVWIQAPNAAWQSVGALTLNDNLEGQLDTLTPHRRFLVMVTPEVSSQVAAPMHRSVLDADIDLDSPSN